MSLHRPLLAAAVIAALGAAPAQAVLPVGTAAPDFTAEASLGGKTYAFSLADALKQGPVVLYFYPAAFTPGCTIEAHDFADAMDEYKALHATVIGVSHDPIDKLKKFSVSECRSKFPVAADADKKIMQSYDAVLDFNPELATRVSYVITPDGKVLYVHKDLNPDKHVANTLEAIKTWRQQSAAKNN